MNNRVIFIVICYFLSLNLSCKEDSGLALVANKATEGTIDKTNDLLREGKNTIALHYLDSSIRANPDRNHLDDWERHRLLVNYYLNYEIDTKKAVSHNDSMFVLLKDKTRIHKLEYAQTLFGKGDILRFEKKYNEAFRYYYDGRTFAMRYLDSCDYSDFTNRLGLIRFAQKQYAQAITFFKFAYQENSSCNSERSFNERFVHPQSILNSIAFSYEQLQKQDSAMHFYREAIRLIDSKAIQFPERKDYILGAKGVIFGNLGGLHLQQRQYAQAEKLLKESILINDKPHFEIEDAQTAKVKLAKVYLLVGKPNEALRLINELQKHINANALKAKPNLSLRLKFLNLRSDYHFQQNDFKTAFQYLKIQDELKDSVTNVNNGLRTVNMEDAFKVVEQGYKLELLNKENTYKDYLIVLGVIFSIVIIILFVIVYRHLKISKKHVATLKLLNERISNQNRNMKKALNALEQSQEDNTNMLKVIAHDLRNPIGAIGMLVSYMNRDKQHTKNDLHIMDMITKSVNSALELTDNLLNIHSKSTQLKKEPEDILTILTYSVDQLKPKANAKNQTLHLNDVKSFMVNIDSGKIWRVLSNLITNAIKFSPQEATINISANVTGNILTISVQDFGIGIPEEHHEKIFEMYSEAKRKGTDGEVSNGLGLSISKQIVEAHQGRIWFETKLGEGTIFYIELPI